MSLELYSMCISGLKVLDFSFAHHQNYQISRSFAKPWTLITEKTEAHSSAPPQNKISYHIVCDC